MYVKWLVSISLLSVLFFFSCSNQDGNAPTKFTEEEGSTLPSSAIVYGRVNDSLNGNTIPNVTVTVYSGATAVSSTTTDGAGLYSFGEFANGAYTMSFVAQNYVSILNSHITVAGVGLNVNKSMSPPTLSGQIRVVLSWYAQNPAVPNIAADLDAYLFNSTDNLYANYDFPSSVWSDGSSAALDKDTTNYSGPETITISNINSATNYSYYVHNYSYYEDCSSLGVSGVHVDVYSGSSIIKSYDIAPGGSGGAVYEFFRIQNGQIVDVNQYNESLSVSGGPSLATCIPGP